MYSAQPVRSTQGQMALALESIATQNAWVRWGKVTDISPLTVEVGGAGAIEDPATLGDDLEVDQVVPCLFWPRGMLVLAGGGGGTDPTAIHTGDDASLNSLTVDSNISADGFVGAKTLQALLGFDGDSTATGPAVSLFDGVSAYVVLKALGANLIGTGSSDKLEAYGLDARSQKITSVANGTSSGDAVNKSQLDLKQDASSAATDAELSAHEADTTSVHGITDTSKLVTGPTSATADDLASFNGTTGKIVKDSGAKAANVPSDGEKAALAGTSGNAVGSTNKLVDDRDARLAAVLPPLSDVIKSLGPALYWTLGAGGGGLTDQSNNGNNGTAQGGVTVGGGASLTSDGGASTDFDGSNDYISSSYAPFAAGSVRTFVGWLSRDTSASADTLFAGNGGGTAPSFQLIAGSSGALQFQQGPGLGYQGVGRGMSFPVTGGTYAWALIIDDAANTVEVFINGTSGGVRPLVDAYATPGNFELGADRASHSDPFDGKMAHVAVFEKALSQASILWLAAVGFGRYPNRDWGLVGALPSGVIAGDTCTYIADATNGIYWNLIYDGQGSYPWKAQGPPLYAEVTTNQTTTSATYAALGTAGPSITVPLAGDYDVEIAAASTHDTAGEESAMSYDIGGTGAVDADSLISRAAATNRPFDHKSRRRRKTGLTAGTTLTAKYKRTTSGTGAFKDRAMWVKPIRVG